MTTPSLIVTQSDTPTPACQSHMENAGILHCLPSSGRFDRGPVVDAGHHKTATVSDDAAVARQTVAVAKAAHAEDFVTRIHHAHRWPSFVPYQSVSIHAKVAGYVKSISVDIGDHVKAGQVIAVLEIPELKDDLKKASAELMTAREEVKRAQANYEDVHLAYQRLTAVAKANPKLVAQQDVDTSRTKDDAMASALSAARNRVSEGEANVGKMQTMLDYASITAPFDGVITKRYADAGALVQAGTASETQTMPVVDIAEDDILRLVFPVPESAVPKVHNGLPVEITINALKQTFPGKVTRFAGKVDVATRTMRTEVDVPNPDGKFTPGMYRDCEGAAGAKAKCDCRAASGAFIGRRSHSHGFEQGGTA